MTAWPELFAEEVIMAMKIHQCHARRTPCRNRGDYGAHQPAISGQICYLYAVAKQPLRVGGVAQHFGIAMAFSNEHHETTSLIDAI